MAGPRLFHISPDCCAEVQIAQIFRANGHEVACHEGGRLAADILYASARDAPLLAPWRKARLVSGLYRLTPHWRPPLEGWRCFALLARHFPDARFLLTTRRVADWTRHRMIRDQGRAARAYAHHPGVETEDLPAIWARDWQAHQDAVAAHFGDDPRLIRLDLDRESPADLAARLAPLVDLPVLPMGGWSLPAPPPPPPLPRPDPAPPGWAEDVAQFCLRGLAPGGDRMTGLSNLACHWAGQVAAGQAPVTDRDGAPRQFAVFADPAPQPPHPLAPHPLALARDGRHFKLIRAEGVINDILRLGRRDSLWIDMEDSRWMGSPQGDPVDQPVLCHNRRAGARNAVLWPLPDQHSIGLPGFDPSATPDQIPFDAKIDRLVWRGMMSGSEMREGVKPGPAAHVWLTRLAGATDARAREAAWDGLCRTNRLHVLRRYIDHPDFDLGAVMGWAFRDVAQHPLLAPYCRPREDRGFFHRFRYQLCMSGYDHGSNFISGLDSRAVLLAEEDGWQVFYSGRFRPWEHYIPVARYLTDIEDKLAWARAHPAECRAISRRARAEAAHLRDPAARPALMRLILDGIAGAR
ncbi:MAG: glycosyl transferase family 90 [Paracoccus sp. (in: a-proteobacteria)]|uniref:glycosyl transferase family 90 n=1 Tax=Paracoccus sp. TaxID=267 RepID=UPI00391AE8A2